jgi:hypothetical protein
MRPRYWGVVLRALAWTVGVGAGGSVRCTTYEAKSLGRLQTLCSDGTRATSYWNGTLERWETTIIESPRTSCTTRMHPQRKDVEVRCQ